VNGRASGRFHVELRAIAEVQSGTKPAPLAPVAIIDVPKKEPNAMNELVQVIMQKTGLPQDKAQEVVDTVVNHFKANLPAGLSGHFDSCVAALQSPMAEGIFEKAKAYAAGLTNKSEA
jgi:hypothetical protein